MPIYQRNLNKLLIFLVLSLSLSTASLFAQPNFVIIVADDQGWTGSSVQMDSSIPGSKSDFYITPELEAMAQTGMVFSQAYSPAPKCSPSRCSILTGRSTARNKFTDTGNQIATDRILIEATTSTNLNGVDTTLAEWLKLTGMNYRTAHFGKWHLGNNTSNPSNNGFDFSDGSTSNGDGSQGGTVQADPKKIFDLTDRAVTYIQDAVTDNVPFFLQLSHYAVHTEIEARQATIDLYNDPAQRPPGSIHTGVEYAAMTEDMDTGIGQLLTAITALGIDDNTYIIFLADNGGQSNVTDNRPLFRGKTFIFEGGIRVPFIIKGPNIAANTYSTEAIVHYDLFPTIAELTGSMLSLPSNLDGQSLVPALTGSSFNRVEPLYFHSPHYETNANKSPRSAVVDGKYKLIVEYETGNIFLYDLSTDIAENTDLSAAQPTLTRDLCVKLRDHLKAADATMPTLDPAHAMFPGMAPDIDADGLEDEWEFRELLSYTYNADDDPDGDGFNNLEEFNNGTDPYMNDMVLALNESAHFGAEVIFDEKVNLSWMNMENGNVDFLEIERSKNATDWERIGKVDAGVIKFVDTRPLEGVAYYRLRVVNQKGEVDFSTTISVLLNASEFIHLFPNPVTESFHIQFKSLLPLPADYKLQIYNNSGQLVRSFNKGSDSFYVGDFSAGIYFAKVYLADQSKELPPIQFVVD